MSSSSCTAGLGSFLKTPKFKLYCSYALSTWANRLWLFALGLVFVEVGGDLRLVAINDLFDCVVVLLFASSIGRWIDVTKRLVAARTMLTITNATVAMCAGVLLVVLYWNKEISPLWGGAFRILLIVLAILLCAVSLLTTIGTKIVLTKDWIVVMCNNEKDELAAEGRERLLVESVGKISRIMFQSMPVTLQHRSEMNAMMRRIDLTASILSPLIAGQLMTSISIVAGCLFITVWNMCSWGVEFWLLKVVYVSAPALSVKWAEEDKTLENTDPASLEPVDNAAQQLGPEIQSDQVKSPNEHDLSRKGCCAKILHGFKTALYGWRAYYRQSVFAAGLSLAFLYLTVLDFDGITTAYGYSQGLKENVLALVGGVGALTGITGTFLFPWMRSKIGLIRTGLVAFALELSCLLFCVGSIWLPGSHFDPIGYFRGDSTEHRSVATTTMSSFTNGTTTSGMNFTLTTSGDSTEANSISQWSIWTFILGIVLARCGLWMADLSVTQIMQESIEEQERGVVFGVQNSTNQLMAMIKDLLVIALPDPRTFGLLIIASWIFIFLGYVSYMVYARRNRGLISSIAR